MSKTLHEKDINNLVNHHNRKRYSILQEPSDFIELNKRRHSIKLQQLTDESKETGGKNKDEIMEVEESSQDDKTSRGLNTVTKHESQHELEDQMKEVMEQI